MSATILKCKSCGANMQIDMESKMITCPHCGTKQMISEILAVQDNTLDAKNKKMNLATKVEFSDAIKHADTHLFKAEYEKAEEYYKLAISLDETNYKGYLGVVRAKTRNFNRMPPNDDYKHYADMATRLAGIDDEIYVVNELKKLDILKEEEQKVRLENEKKKEKEKRAESTKHERVRFFSKLAYFLTGFVAILLLIGIVVSSVLKDKDKSDPITQIEISTAADFEKFLTDKKYLGVSVVLKNDIDMGEKELTPASATENSSYSGSFNGNGYTIKNLKISVPCENEFAYGGIFAKTDGAKISGLVLDNIKITLKNKDSKSASASLGILVGFAKNTDITNCSVLETCEIKTENSKCSLCAGGIVGRGETLNVKLSYSLAKLNITETSTSKSNFIGGIVGYSDGTVVEISYFAGKINTEITAAENLESNINAYIGGISGVTDFRWSKTNKIFRCFFSGTVENTGEETGKEESVNFITTILNPAEVNDNHINLIYENCILDENNETNIYAEKIAKDETELVAWISQKFSENYWTKLDTPLPKLKIDKSTNKVDETKEENASQSDDIDDDILKFSIKK